ncbi:hypothetical protein Vadar_001417 [Vaccinium darrowii]|uniref:Uncharacterized protein n=1 Tax=Vaccinium darrowii TaxID=229202 RepID=A0ACB7XWP2_9ERIC|nr:hypothetical protein Vadar_001417 [Vaccinium darrowii]
MTVKSLVQNSQLIHCEVSILNSDVTFLASFVYGANYYMDRHELWNSLNNIKSPNPWIVLGDFNSVRFPQEKSGSMSHWPSYMDDINTCLYSNELDDLRYSGCFFTWSNRQAPPYHISNKLDRVLVNDSWNSLYPHSSAFFPIPGVSDHSPGIVHLTPPPKKGSRPFKFFDFLAEHPQFLNIVQKVWRVIIIGNPMYCIVEKLRNLQADLKTLNTKEFSSISTRVKDAKFQLDTLQKRLGSNPFNPATQSQERIVYKQYLELARAEESLARQKSRIQWLNLGDQCTSFFFKSINNNRNRRKITTLTLSDTTVTHDPNEIKTAFVDFYTTLLGTPHHIPYLGTSRVEQLITNKLSTEQSHAMVIEITDEEIRDTFLSLNPHKAPGPDGYNAGFFQKAWSIVGHDVISAIKNFFRSGKLLRKVNSTSVALVPKVPNPSKISDFRPISCCNTLYKCIAKILSKRIRVALPYLIDSVQSSFVKGRRIADNIFLTQELMRGYHTSSPSPRCALKVDIMKAYDNVRWEFLWDILESMNFHPKMIQWIQACVSTASYNLNINGEPTGHILGKKGLRQGDPLSSYLFVIIMEVLTCILKEKAKLPDFHFHWRCERTKIINLCFADDLMIFCKGDLSSIKHIQASLIEFESLSGLAPSPGKSNIFFSGVNSSTKADILTLLGFKEGSLPIKYLGVPLLSTKLKHIDCKPLIDKITSKTKSWTNRDLTYAGRVQLIKSILFSMQTYWSSIFILPKKVIKEVESILRAFFWSGPDLKKTGAKVSWDHLCSPRQEGGLGFKSMHIWNKAAISKHIWFLIAGGEQSMWCQWVKSYLLKGRSFWEVKIPSNPSWIWRKILNLRPLVQHHIKTIIGNGDRTSLWFDDWHPLGPLAERFGPRIIYDSGLPRDAKVSAIIKNSKWAFPITQTIELNEVRSSMSSLPEPNLTIDHHRWTLTPDGK